jgi:hypothetical protein
VPQSSWKDAVIEALCAMGGSGEFPLRQIAEKAKGIRENRGGHVGERWYYRVSEIITSHSSDSDRNDAPPLGSANDIFKTNKIHSGLWGLRNPENYCTDFSPPLTDDEVEEGYNQDRLASFRKRNAQKIMERKEQDNYTCQACNFRLNVNGIFIIDCHHKNPLSTGARITKIDDLICLCPSCHRIAHSRKPPLSLDEVRAARQAIPIGQVGLDEK